MSENKTDHEILIDKILNSYLETAIWSAGEQPNGENLDTFTIYGFVPDSTKSAREDIESFYKLAAPLLTDAEKIPEDIGHNFSLDRNGHGAGFWDGDYKNGDALSKLCNPFGSVDIYAGDDGKLYFE